jgi:hypothetical protein
MSVGQPIALLRRSGRNYPNTPFRKESSTSTGLSVKSGEGLKSPSRSRKRTLWLKKQPASML